MLLLSRSEQEDVHFDRSGDKMEGTWYNFRQFSTCQQQQQQNASNLPIHPPIGTSMFLGGVHTPDLYSEAAV